MMPDGAMWDNRNTNFYVPRYMAIIYMAQPNVLFNFLVQLLSRHVLNGIIHYCEPRQSNRKQNKGCAISK